MKLRQREEKRREEAASGLPVSNSGPKRRPSVRLESKEEFARSKLAAMEVTDERT